MRNLGVKGYCATHLAQLYGTFAPEVFALAGVGVPAGVERPEFGPAIVDLRCNACGATWSGPAGEACGWCERSHQQLLGHQAELVLAPPEIDPDDARWDDVMQGWANRLWVAVEAGIVEQRDAENALRRKVQRVAA